MFPVVPPQVASTETRRVADWAGAEDVVDVGGMLTLGVRYQFLITSQRPAPFDMAYSSDALDGTHAAGSAMHSPMVTAWYPWDWRVWSIYSVRL